MQKGSWLGETVRDASVLFCSSRFRLHSQHRVAWPGLPGALEAQRRGHQRQARCCAGPQQYRGHASCPPPSGALHTLWCLSNVLSRHIPRNGASKMSPLPDETPKREWLVKAQISLAFASSFRMGALLGAWDFLKARDDLLLAYHDLMTKCCAITF